VTEKQPHDRFDDIVGALGAEGAHPAAPGRPRSARRGYQWIGTLGWIGVAVVAELLLLVLFGWSTVLGLVTAALLLAWLVSAGSTTPSRRSPRHFPGRPPGTLG
jgi:hypothetical protein